MLPRDILNLIYKKKHQLHYQDLIDEYKSKLGLCIDCQRLGINLNICDVCQKLYCNYCTCWQCIFLQRGIKLDHELFRKYLSYEIISIYFILKIGFLSKRPPSISRALCMIIGIRHLSNKIILSTIFSRLLLNYNNRNIQSGLYVLGYATSMQSMIYVYDFCKNLFVYNRLPFF